MVCRMLMNIYLNGAPENTLQMDGRKVAAASRGNNSAEM